MTEPKTNLYAIEMTIDKRQMMWLTEVATCMLDDGTQLEMRFGRSGILVRLAGEFGCTVEIDLTEPVVDAAKMLLRAKGKSDD